MKKINLLLAGILIITFSGCEYESYKEYRTPPYDGDFTWTEVTDEAEWENRWDHAAIAFDGKLWIFGGYNPGGLSGDSYLSDVWSSHDGIEWTLHNEKAPWHGRRGHSAVVFVDDRGPGIYIIGGFEVEEKSGHRQYTNDVWRSYDGYTWTQIKPRTYNSIVDSLQSWFPRFNHACIVTKHNGTDYIYLTGGFTQLENHNVKYASVYFNDVWRSNNGIEWEKLDNNDYGIRSDHAMTVDTQTGQMFIQGGMHGVIFEGENNGSQPIKNWHDLWSSYDGIQWTAENDLTNFDQGYLGRAGHGIFFYNGILYAMPGRSNSNEHFHFTRDHDHAFWKRNDIEKWSIDSYGSDFDARYGYATVNHDNKIWVIGGMTNGNGQQNDVWNGEIK